MQDTGSGIAPEKVESVFGSFAQADNSITRRFGGTGLGLAISAQLANLFGGKIRVDSEPGVGSTFHLEIPVDFATGPVHPTDAVVRMEPETTDASLCVLVAEDHPVNRKLVSVMLKKAGHRAILTENGAECVEALKARDDIDVVLMDMQMPVMDGLEATRTIRAHEAQFGRYTPIVALTANAIEGSREECLQAGMDDFLTKPVRTQALSATLSRIANNRTPH